MAHTPTHTNTDKDKRNLTLRYTYTGELPSDLSSAFFRITQVPHVKCFLSGSYIVVGISDEEHLGMHTSRDMTSRLKENGFHLVESMEARANRTLLAFRLNKVILETSLDQLKTEIQEKNEVQLDEVQLLTAGNSSKFLKIRLSTPAEADKLKQTGIRALSLILPSYSLEREKVQSVRQCLRCYKFDHETQECKKKNPSCSKCAAEGHSYKTCKEDQIKCLNCNGRHIAVSYSCPEKKTAMKVQNDARSSPPAPTQGINTNTNTPPPPPLDSSSPSYASIAASQPSATTRAEAVITSAKVQACAAAASELSKGSNETFAEVFPHLLKANNLPEIIIPPSALALAEGKTEAAMTTPTIPATTSHQEEQAEQPPTGENELPTDAEETPVVNTTGSRPNTTIPQTPSPNTTPSVDEADVEAEADNTDSSASFSPSHHSSPIAAALKVDDSFTPVAKKTRSRNTQ